MQITWLSSGSAGTREELGGKGVNLLALVRAGFRVPPGFVIPASAAGGLDAPEARDAIADAWEALRGEGVEVAVRSSATDEDGQTRSFAGQHETVLGIRDRDALFDAVVACVASLNAEGARAYRGAAADGSGMAVVVQRMVDAVFSGVAFSVDPVTGDQGRVVVEVIAGTGARLMSGEERGALLVIDRQSLDIIESDPESELVNQSAAGEIARAALDAEELFGTPQDIEFAHDGETLWVLQSRAITATGAPGQPANEFDTPTDEQTVWTSANIQEVLPGLLTPLTITTSKETSRVGYNVGFQRLHMLAEGEWQPFMGVFYNRAFLNLTLTRLVADRTLGGDGDAVEQQYLAGERGATGPREPWRRRIGFKLRSTVPLAKTVLQLHSIADRIDRDTRAIERETFGLDLASLSDAELNAQFERVTAYGASIFGTHLQVSGVASFGYDLVTRFVEPTLKAETPARVPSLFSGMRGVESAKIGLDIWDLTIVARNTRIEEEVTRAGFDPWAPELHDGWRAAWRTFIANHGHRGLNEMEASARPWRMDPAPVLRMVASYLELDEERSPAATLSRQETERLRLTRQLARRMNPLKRRLFSKVLGEAQGWVALRERTKSVIVRAARIPDALLPEIQRRFVERGIIEAPEDVFFLTREELRTVLGGEVAPMQDRVARRRREYERNRHIELPERFAGQPEPMVPEEPGTESTSLKGTPVSPGIVTARARVMFDPGVDGPLEPGEILVAPVTDAGWTPLFALAGGLVVDLGSTLSHGSTVAREYGLPAVVNVHTGTRIIRTGDLLTVNGSTGTVTVTRDAG